MTNSRKILITSCAVEKVVWEPVVQALRDKGHQVSVLQMDKVVMGEIDLSINIGANGMHLHYDGKPLHLASFDAAWYRRTLMFGYEESSPIRQYTLRREVNALQQALWAEVPNRAWLNPLSKMQRAERKITQLKVAQKIGFAIPQTIISNSWQTIQSELPEEVIIKSCYGMLDGGEDIKLLYTKPFANSPEVLPTAFNPYPGIWQENLKKAREWRITVVGDQVFPAAIYTDADAKDDWRRQQSTDKVRFEHGDFPQELQEKCKLYLRTFGLRFGAFDFVEDSAGCITFLECNTNGQFGWLEDLLDMPISAAIADSLEAIALRRPLRHYDKY
jgi:glutathione synthase/RimK-type ligase-like ATP-grasp enzyme